MDCKKLMSKDSQLTEWKSHPLNCLLTGYKELIKHPEELAETVCNLTGSWFATYLTGLNNGFLKTLSQFWKPILELSIKSELEK